MLSMCPTKTLNIQTFLLYGRRNSRSSHYYNELAASWFRAKETVLTDLRITDTLQ